MYGEEAKKTKTNNGSCQKVKKKKIQPPECRGGFAINSDVILQAFILSPFMKNVLKGIMKN